MTEKLCIPEHVMPIVEDWKNHASEVRYWDCFCVAAIFFSPEIMALMGTNEMRNSQIARNYLFNEGRFVESPYSLGSGSLTVYSHHNHIPTDWFERDFIEHIHVRVSSNEVLTMDRSSDFARLVVVSGERDYRWWFGSMARYVQRKHFVKSIC